MTVVVSKLCEVSQAATPTCERRNEDCAAVSARALFRACAPLRPTSSLSCAERRRRRRCPLVATKRIERGAERRSPAIGPSERGLDRAASSPRSSLSRKARPARPGHSPHSRASTRSSRSLGQPAPAPRPHAPSTVGLAPPHQPDHSRPPRLATTLKLDCADLHTTSTRQSTTADHRTCASALSHLAHPRSPSRRHGRSLLQARGACSSPSQFECCIT